MATPQANIPILHRFLGIGQVIVAAVFLVLRYLGAAPILSPDEGGSVIGYALAGFGMVLLAVALLVFKPRVPARRPEFLMEGAGILPAVGFLVTGHAVPLIVMGLAIVVFWMSRPDALATA
jgi:hypothetical protein